MKIICRGAFMHQYLEQAAKNLDIDLILVPDFYSGVQEIPDLKMRKSAIEGRILAEIDWIRKTAVENKEDLLCFIYFFDWIYPINDFLDRIPCKKVFWSIEDPNHFNMTSKQANAADIILTSAAECVISYRSIYPDKPVYTLTMACEPYYHNPGDLALAEREWDIVFVGNRYPAQPDRCLGEFTVFLPALKWALKNGKKFGVWGLWDGELGWSSCPLVVANRQVYQAFTGCMEAPNIYRNAKIVLCMNEQLQSPTMTSMRTYEACASGAVVLSHYSVATENLFGNTVLLSQSAEETETLLTDIFSGSPIKQFYELLTFRCVSFVYEHHTYTKRLQELVYYVSQLGGK